MLRANFESRQGIYAGFLPRAVAFGLDYLIIAVYLIVVAAIGYTARLVVPAVEDVLFSNPLSAELTGFLLVTLPVTLYFALPESTPGRQATWGKRCMGLVVSGPGGQCLSLPRSLLRSLLKFVPWELAHFTIWQYAFIVDSASPLLDACLALVWLLVGANLASLWFSPTHQALYDRLAGTWVMRNRDKDWHTRPVGRQLKHH